jgi:hypothetical protein
MLKNCKVISQEIPRLRFFYTPCSERKKVQYICVKSAVHHVRPEKNSGTCCFKNVFKIIFRMRQNYWPARIKFTVETTRNKDSARYLIIETTFWNYSYRYRHLYGSECNLKKTSTSISKTIGMSLKYYCNLKTLKTHECTFPKCTRNHTIAY